MKGLEFLILKTGISKKDPLIFLISGKAKSGKDTSASIINKIATERNLKSINIQYSFYMKEYVKNISDWDGNEATKPRELIQFIGTDLIRGKIDDLFFINRICQDINVYSYFFDIITISDVRLISEIEIPKARFENVISIHLKRENFENNLSIKEKHHRTEIDLDEYSGFDYIINNNGTIKDLEKEIKIILNKKERL